MSNPIAILLQNLDLPSIKDDVKFENFVTAFFNEIGNTDSYKRFGRLGQNQYGFDIYSNVTKTVIQCKVKTRDGKLDRKIREKLIKELKSDFIKFQEYNQINNLSYNRFIFASTFCADTFISTECTKLSKDNLIVEYWSWDDFKNQMPNNTFRFHFNDLIPFLKNASAESKEPNQCINSFKFDRSSPIINQLYDYFKYLFSEINVLPIHLFKNNYPFKISDDFNSYYSVFTLNIENKELFELFESLKIRNGKVSTNNKFKIDVKNSSNKLKFILEKLSSQLIFYIQQNEYHKTIKIRYSNEKSCTCPRCSFGRLKYEDSFKGLQKKPKNLEEKLLFAYMHYELGNFAKSAEYFVKVASLAKNKKQHIRYAIAKFNLSRLYVFIKNNYWGKNSQPGLIKKLSGIETEKIYSESQTGDNKKLLDWILTSKFYNTKRDEINREVSKIIDHYHLQLKGGWSSNNNIWSLINEYAEIDTFLNSNFIVYDRFLEFQELTDNFIEGLIVSHAMEEKQTSRLEYFDDWLFLRIIFNGNADRILKLFKRYEIKTLKYKSTSKKGDTFLDVVNNHLTNYKNILSIFEKVCEKSNRIFWDKYNSIFCNLILLISLSDIEPNQIKIISKNLLKYLIETNFIFLNSMKYVRLFLSKKSEFIDEEVLYGFLDLFINNGKFHDNIYFETIINEIRKNYKVFNIDKEKLDELLIIAFDNCKICNHKHSPEFLPSIYNATNSVNKEKIKTRIEDELKNQFNSNLYYMSAIYSVFNGHDNFFDLFIESAKPKSQSASFISFFSGTEDNRLPQINMLLNLCFKNEIDLSQSKFDVFRNIDDYYSWLFDLEHFDYKKFNPKWATEYPTKYYYEQFKKYPIIKEKALAYLKGNSDYIVEKLIIELSNEETNSD